MNYNPQTDEPIKGWVWSHTSNGEVSVRYKCGWCGENAYLSQKVEECIVGADQLAREILLQHWELESLFTETHNVDFYDLPILEWPSKPPQ